MPKRIGSDAVRAPARPKVESNKNLPAIFVGAELSKKIDKAIVDPGKKKELQLRFSSAKGFLSPSGNPLQVVYLDSKSTKRGLSITYVDAQAKQFWAQAPGYSGLARGPFKLPKGADKDVAKATARAVSEDTAPKHGRGVRTDIESVSPDRKSVV